MIQRRSFLLGWMLVLLPAALSGQQTTFIMHFDSVQNGRGGRALNIEETPGGYLVCGYQTSPGPFHQFHTFLRSIDHQGHVLTDQEHWYGDPWENFPGFYWDQLTPLDEGTYIGSIDSRTAVGTLDKVTYWVRYDASGDTLAIKEVKRTNQPDSAFFGFNQCAQHGAQGAVTYVGTLMEQDDPKTQGWMVRCDGAGDTLWTKKVGPPDHFITLYSIDQYPFDGGMVVCGDEFYPGIPDDHLLIRTDSLGNIIWRLNFGGQGVTPPTVCTTPDSGMVTWTSRDLAPGPDTEVVLELRKWNAMGDPLWNTTIGPTPNHFLMAQNMEVMEDGSIICAAQHLGYAGLWKFSAQGDSLWLRHYLVFSSPGFGFTMPYDVEPTSDGGYVFCGFSQQGNADPTPNLSTWFVVKTDSLGCVVPGCHLVGVDEYEISLQNELVIWPNPVAGHLQLELELPPGYPLSGAVTARLLDLQGREVRHWPAELIGGKVYLSTTDLPAQGSYVLHLTDARRWLAGGKVVVE